MTYVKLDGDVGILGNGAGLVMSTLDVVALAGGRPANFLDAGGGSKADEVVTALEVLLSDPKVKVLLVNIFGGITRCDEVAEGLLTALDAARAPPCPSWCGWTAPTRRRAGAIIRRAGPGQRGRRADDALGGARRRPSTAGRRRPAMSILVDGSTKLVVQGITGREGAFHADPQQGLRHQRRGRRDPRQGRPGRRRHPGVQHRGRRRRGRPGRTRRWSSCRPRFAADALYEAVESRRRAHHLHHRGHPGPRDDARLHPPAPRRPDAGRAELPRASSARAGPPWASCRPRSSAPGRVGLVSRSGTLTYQISKELALLGIGQSTVVGIGGDPVVGSSFIDILARFEADPETDLVVMVGEIGGAEEEKAADYIAASMSTPGRRLHRRLPGPAGQADGPRRGDHHRLLGHGAGQEGRPGGQGRPRRAPTRPRSPNWPRPASAETPRSPGRVSAARRTHGMLTS